MFLLRVLRSFVRILRWGHRSISITIVAPKCLSDTIAARDSWEPDRGARSRTYSSTSRGSWESDGRARSLAHSSTSRDTREPDGGACSLTDSGTARDAWESDG